MRQEIQLYLNGKEVFFSEPPEINFVYQRTDYTNPTIIKNSYTKTLTIEGTPENNQIFNSIYNLERTQGVINENYFNPSKRVSFELYENGDILEQGYAKLDKVRREGYKIEYEVTLYGGLGDFFYGLSYNEQEGSDEGRKLTLADLTYREELWEGEYGDEIDLDFTINRDTVEEAWDSLNHGTDLVEKKWDIISFAPAYNGLPKGIDSNKVLIDPESTEYISMREINGSTITDISGFPTDKGAYSLYSGYALGELDSNLTEWEVRDLRSYLQRPVMSIKGLFNGVANSTKYNLVLDKDFFNSKNRYWNDAWFTLPMLSKLDNKSEQKDSYVLMDTPVVIGSDYRYKLKANFDDAIYKGINSISVRFRPTIWVKDSAAEKLFPSYYPTNNLSHRVYGGLTAQLIGFDSSNSPVASSDIVFMTSTATHGKYTNSKNLSELPFEYVGPDNQTKNDYGYFEKVTNTSIETDAMVITKSGLYPTENPPQFEDVPLIEGWDDPLFQYRGDTEYKWCRDLNLSLDGGDKNIAYVVLRLAFVNSKDKFVGKLATTNTTKTGEIYNIIGEKGAVARYLSGNMTLLTPDDVYSGALITKKKLLSSIKGTPCDFLISYCKLFNLYFEKDIYSDTITIRHRSNWYDGTIVDIDDCIDHTKEIEVRPISFDNKFYDFNYDDKDGSSAAKDYYSDKGTIFGCQRVNTGYNFDSSSKDLLSGTVFKNGVQVRETSKFFKFMVTNTNDNIGLPPFLYNKTIKYNLYNNLRQNTELTLAYPTGWKVFDYSYEGGFFDNMNRLQLHGDDNAAIDGSGVLCFFNGFQSTERITLEQGRQYIVKIHYGLSDDLQEMIDLNGKPCWFYTNDETKAIQLSSLPLFSRYTDIQGANLNQIGTAWDFGAAASYLNGYRYTSLSTIYSRFWKDYISDLYDIDTRIVTAYVRLKGKVLGDMLKHFYFWDNSYWVLTKIIDYNITSFDTVKCEFAKVKDLKNYTDKLNFNTIVELTLRDSTDVPAEGGVIVGDLYVSDGGEWYVISDSDIVTATPNAYAGGSDYNTITFVVSPNTVPFDRETYVSVKVGETGKSFTIKQARAELEILEISSTGIITFEGGYSTLKIKSNKDWTLTSNSSDMFFQLEGSISKVRSLVSSGNKTVYAYLGQNTSPDTRNVTVTCRTQNKTVSVGIKQDGSHLFLNYKQAECISCGSCDGMLDACPIGLSFTFDSEGNRVIENLSTCIGCGSCNFGSMCPVSALYQSTEANDMFPIVKKTILPYDDKLVFPEVFEEHFEIVDEQGEKLPMKPIEP